MKKLHKVEEGKMICGVCTGVAEYLNMDVTLIRLVLILLTVFTAFSGIIFYIIAALLMPEDDNRYFEE